MLKLSDNWTWYFDEDSSSLLLEISDELLFRSNLAKSALIPCAFNNNVFSVDDALAYESFQTIISTLELSNPHKAELLLNCVAAKRFQKPLQPKSWFFDHSQTPCVIEEGELIKLSNELNSGEFIVIEAGEVASTCVYIGYEQYLLSEHKSLKLGDSIKVMNDRFVMIDVVNAASRLIA